MSLKQSHEVQATLAEYMRELMQAIGHLDFEVTGNRITVRDGSTSGHRMPTAIYCCSAQGLCPAPHQSRRLSLEGPQSSPGSSLRFDARPWG